VTSKQAPRLRFQVAILTLSRLVLNTGLRMVYPFLPAFARGLGVPVAALAPLVSLRGFAALLSPVFAPISERFGRRPVLMISMLVFSAGCSIVVLWPAYWPFGLSLAIISLSKVIYDPAMQAYIGDVVPYQRRGRVLAVTELSWAGAFFLGMPAVGFVIQQQGWTAPFVWLGLFGVAAALLLWRSLPGPVADQRSGTVTTIRETVKVIADQRVIWAAAFYVFLVMAANELLLIIYGVWMEENFNLTLTTLGLATSVIGIAELTGEILTGFSIDRIGKRRFLIITGFVSALMYLAVPFVSVTLTMTLLALFSLFVFFEMTVVGGVPLMSELVPSARGIVLSVALASGGLGRGIGALIGPAIWQFGNIRAIGLTSAVMMLAALVILAIWVREGQSS
jgi:predicted MFS family arabinose efflux permease